MPLTIDVWFDYICPFSVMARKIITETVGDEDVHVRWRPYELHPEGIPATGKKDYPDGVWENSVLPMGERFGIAFRADPPSPLPHTGRALRGFDFAQRHGAGLAYNDRLFEAHLGEHRDIGDPAVLAALVGEIGLDAEAFDAQLASAADLDRYRQEQREAAAIHRIHTVPTVTVGPWRTEGVPDAGRLAQALDFLSSRAAAQTRSATRARPATPHTRAA
ncbi:DsbA family oxidoreductase [Streptomyces sp. NBC_01022]|uniref:DsbA family oxidoreductase n=1 Tax=Streptomyces sp. NBC_01022 TaxID=2903723 RepID=UPI002DDB7EAE|nr:DsbA family protein [Streptomyces sp. NBC_01022]WRZ87541.1 DsbA family protein [Streptomyces sp. NBC_01022]